MSKLRSLAKNAARRALSDEDRAEIHDDVAVRRNMKKQDAEIDKRDKREAEAHKQQPVGPYDRPTEDQDLMKKTVTRTLNAGKISSGGTNPDPVYDFEEEVADHFENLSEWELWHLLKKDLESKRGN